MTSFQRGRGAWAPGTHLWRHPLHFHFSSLVSPPPIISSPPSIVMFSTLFIMVPAFPIDVGSRRGFPFILWRHRTPIGEHGPWSPFRDVTTVTSQGWLRLQGPSYPSTSHIIVLGWNNKFSWAYYNARNFSNNFWVVGSMSAVHQGV